MLPSGFSGSGLSHSKTHGLLVTGTLPKCGKTVACAGLAGVLTQLGFRTQAIKPLSFQAKVSIRQGHEQSFFNKILPPLQSLELIAAESPQSLNNLDWQRYVDTCRRHIYPYILETPGSMASPIRYIQDEVMDSIDLAKALEIPMLIVTPKQPDIIAALAPTFAYLWHRDADVTGWLAVETLPPPTINPNPNWHTDILYLTHHYKVPYLGEITYSPSISVETLQQGNLLRTTELGVDLLPIQQALNLLIP